MISWQMQLILNAVGGFMTGAFVGFFFRRRLTLALIVTTFIVLLTHLAIDFSRGSRAVTATFLQDLAAGLILAAVPLLLFDLLPAIAGAVLVIVSCRLMRG